MNDITASKFLSLVLRHQPQTIGMTLDPEGWLVIADLIENANRCRTPLTLTQLHSVVATSDKRRFILSDDGLRIRANQGHSIPNVNLNLEPTLPPDKLFHGTIAEFMEPIKATGLDKRSRNHVHLTSDLETARRVGQRRGQPVILTIHSGRMQLDGYTFYLSENDVWLTESVPADYIDFPS